MQGLEYVEHTMSIPQTLFRLKLTNHNHGPSQITCDGSSLIGKDPREGKFALRRWIALFGLPLPRFGAQSSHGEEIEAALCAGRGPQTRGRLNDQQQGCVQSGGRNMEQ